LDDLRERASNYLGRRLAHRRLFRNKTIDSLTQLNYNLQTSEGAHATPNC